ncbi:MAG: PAS-domain containing protein [Pseudomonadota bacterium]
MDQISLQSKAETDTAVAILKDAFSGIDFGMALLDEDLNFILFNEKYSELAFAGLASPKIGQNAINFSIEQMERGLYVLPPAISPAQMTQSLVEAVRTCQKHIELERTDGVFLVASSKKTALGGYLISVSDVTDRKRAEAAEEDRWRAVTDAVGALKEGFALWDADFRFMMCNKRYEELILSHRAEPLSPGTPGENAIREAFRSGTVDLPEDLTEEDYVEGVMTWVRSYGDQIEAKYKDGRTIIASANRTELGGVLLTALDVTEERNAQAKARALLFDAMESLEEGFALWDSEMRFLMCNKKHLEIVAPYRKTPWPAGTPADETIVEAFHSGVHALANDLTEHEYLSDISAWAQNFEVPREFHYRDGRTVIITPHRTELGGYLLTSLDVTEARNTEIKAREMLLDAFQALDEGLVLCDEKMNYIFSNDAWKKMLFQGREDGIPKPGESVIENLIAHVRSGYYAIPENMSEDDYVAWMMGEMSQHGKQVHYGSADGRHFIGSSHLTAFGGSLLFVRDVTKQFDAEENRLAAVNDALDAIDDPLALFSAGHRFLLANKAWLEMVKGRGEPEHGDTADSLFSRLLENGFYKLPEGVTREEFYTRGLSAMQDFATNYPLSLDDGTEQLANSRKTGLGGFLLSYRDVTEQMAVEAELKQQREITHQNEKLSALGELLAGVAHELNNPLSVVFGYSQMLQGKVEDPVLSERVDLICQASERAAKIVRTFLAMARQRPMESNPCSVNDVVVTALEVSSYSLKSNGTQVRVELDDENPEVIGDFDQLAQVLSNLVVNAGHAVQDKGEAGKIVIKSYASHDGTQVTIEIADNGYGIPEDIQPRIFEPFFTTKDVGQGTGIGLAFSHRIVESHNGALTLTSTPGDGTCFYVRLPVAPNAEPVENAPAHSLTQVKRVLVVDDEEGVARLISDMLAEEGLHVTKSTNPRSALKLAEAEQFDIVLSDFKMPDMNGETFFRAMEAIAPKNAARTAFVTGDSMGTEVRRFLSSSKRPWIEKPIMRGELLELIARTSNGDF